MMRPEKDRRRGNHPSERGHRDNVAIADGPERDDGPPHRLRDGAEFLGLRLALDADA